MRFELPESRFVRAVPIAALVPFGLILLLFKPAPDPKTVAGGVDPNTATCLDNLNQIGRAFALYSADWDGKIPRGVDPEDRFNPSIWQTNDEYGGAFFNDAKQTPYLHEVLRPYVKSREVFHCPADVGWTKSQLTMLTSSSLKNVKPSSFAKYGTSYYVYTKYGFSGLSADDIEEPANALLLFDGDLWHLNAGKKLLNGLFADGHAQNLTASQFEFYSSN